MIKGTLTSAKAAKKAIKKRFKKKGAAKRVKKVEQDKPLSRTKVSKSGMKGFGEDEDLDLTSNLTGGQIQEILDFLILESLSPIVKNSSIFDIQIGHLLALTTRNKKRKVSAHDRDEFRNMLCRYMLTGCTEEKLQILADAKIERGFFYTFVVNFLKEVEGYTDVYLRFLVTADEMEHNTLDKKLKCVEASVGVSRDRLFSTINMCQDFLDQTYVFRNGIVENYLKNTFSQAKAFCAMKGPNFEFNDVYQNFLAAVTKAVDKYDSSKGALTSYINFWILNAQTSNSDHGHEYGIAYTVPQAQKKNMATGGSTDINYSVSLEQEIKSAGEEEADKLLNHLEGDPGVDEKIEHQQGLDMIRYLAKCADIRGIARLHLDLDEFFSKRELGRMRRTMREQLAAT